MVKKVKKRLDRNRNSSDGEEAPKKVSIDCLLKAHKLLITDSIPYTLQHMVINIMKNVNSLVFVTIHIV